MVMLLLSQGDIESNPGPNQRTSNCFPCSHWNVNSIMAHTANNDILSIDIYIITWANYPHNQKKVVYVFISTSS